MAKRLYRQALEPRTLDERVRRLEQQLRELTQTVATLTQTLREQTGQKQVDKSVTADASTATSN